MRRLRIGTRLVLGTAVLATLVLGVALAVARFEITRVLHDSAVTLAEGDLNSFAVDLQRNPGEEPDTVANGLLIVIRDPDGRTVRDTAPHDVREALPARATGDRESTLDDDEGRSYVIVSRVVRTAQGDWSLWAARDVSSSRSAVTAIDVVFVLMGTGLLLLLVSASWWLVRGALRPVEELRRHAELLADGELLPVADNDDELARLAATLNDSVTRVRESSARERRMVSDAAHELRTPLAALAAELELTRRRLDDRAAVAEGLVNAQRSAERLGALASNLLELSRLDEHRRATGAETGRAVVDDVLAAVDRARTRAADSRVDIDAELRIANPEARYRLDPLALARAVDNLLDNALRAVGAAGTITVTVDDAGGDLLLRVDDDGPGAPEDFLPLAFERFSRADASRREPGSGLGLALVRAIAAAGGGTVHVENRHPGFRAEIRLPKM